MTSRQIEIIENSWDFVLLNTEETGAIFYEKLFELRPELRQLFRDDIKSQSQKLISLITFVVHKANNLDEIIPDVRALGSRHKTYRVKPEYYNIVGSALLWTLEKQLNNLWDEETKKAWTTIYELLSKIMIEAQESEPRVLQAR
jgi:hemoglobin-like flavoprotein